MLVLGAAACSEPTRPGSDLSPLANVRASADAKAVTPIDLGTLGGNLSVARGINARGQVVGTTFFAPGVQRATLWTTSAPSHN